MSQSTPEETLSLLNRLAQKPGVSSTLILSRFTGSVVRASGLVSTASASGDSASDGTAEIAPPATSQDLNSTTSNKDSAVNGDDTDKPQGRKMGMKSAEDVARLVWRLFGGADEFSNELMGTEDEVRLLRLRTKRNEIVVVPDANFLLVVVHDTPPA